MGQRLPAGSNMYWWPRSSVSAAGNANQTPRHRVPPISTSVSFPYLLKPPLRCLTVCSLEDHVLDYVTSGESALFV